MSYYYVVGLLNAQEFVAEKFYRDAKIGTIYEDVCKTQGYALPANVSDYPPDKEIRRPHNFDAYRYSQFKVRDSLKRNLCPYDLRGIRNSGVVSPYADAEQSHQTSSG